MSTMTNALRRAFRGLLRAFRAPETYHDPQFIERMQRARRYGVEQKRASIHSQRNLRQQQVNRLETAYLHEKGGDR